MAQTMDDQKIFTVAEINEEVAAVLGDSFDEVWVKGEISRIVRPASGHLYFTLKDENAQVRCAMFKGFNQHLNIELKDGDEVIVKSRISIYQARGDYQLIIEDVSLAGLGELQRQFEKLKNKLAQEGLFNEENKKQLPKFPVTVGIVTSKTGAAIKDALHVLNKRFPLINVYIYPTLVQGKDAPENIISAINLAQQHATCDVLLLVRGGGSIEDLWAFNNEKLARTISECNIPCVSGIGHEIDFTITDFVVDFRAPTPSAAAEAISPDHVNIKNMVNDKRERLLEIMQNILGDLKEEIKWITKTLNFYHPKNVLNQHAQRLDELFLRLQMQQKEYINRKVLLLSQLQSTLKGISPIATLDRGYAIVTHENNLELVKDSDRLSLDEKIKIRFKRGQVRARVTEKIKQ
ncbi:MAG: exodeoxyribonuclease VII large subunit [Pseudomonadota bacterium]